MVNNPFLPGDHVITMFDYGGVPSGAIGQVVNRWRGTAYAVKLPDGTFGWLDSNELVPEDPSRSFMKEGDIGMVVSDKHNHGFAKVGDRLPVVKVVDDMDYYGVLFDDQRKCVSGIQLARHI